MNYDHIAKILEKYFEGHTTLEEEAELSAFFRKGDLPAEWRPYQAIFQFRDAAATISMPSKLEEAIEQDIDHLAATAVSRLPRRSFLRYAAAIAVLLIGLAGWLQQEPVASASAAIDWSKYEPESPEAAAVAYQNALRQLSKAMHAGASSAAQNVKRIEPVGHFFD